MSTSLSQLERLYRTRGAAFFRLALARTGDVQQAQDAVQEGFARAIRRRASFRGSGSLDAWVARCVVNAARDEGRREHPPPLAPGSSSHVPPTDDSGVTLVREAVRRLPPRQRDALFLRHYLDFDYAAVAEALGVEVGTVSATLHAARASLAETLQEVAR